MPEAPRAPRSVPPCAGSRMTMLELWRWACAAGVAGGGAADCLEVAVVGATLVGWADAGAAGACFAWTMRAVALSAVMAAKVTIARIANGRVGSAVFGASERFGSGDLI